jgi:hypothetical protein
VPKAAKRKKTASAKELSLQKRAIRELMALDKALSSTVSGSALAKQARALERALASRSPRKATTQRRVEAFTAAARKYSPPARRVLKKTRKVAARKAKTETGVVVKTAPTGTPGIVKSEKRNKAVRYQTRVYQCLADYETCCQHHDWKTCAAMCTLCIVDALKALGLGPAAYLGAKSLVGLIGH